MAAPSIKGGKNGISSNSRLFRPARSILIWVNDCWARAVTIHLEIERGRKEARARCCCGLLLI